MPSRTIDYAISIEPCPTRVRFALGQTVVADSTRALVLYETRRPATYYLPWADVRTALLSRNAHQTHCPFKGNASYWDLQVGTAIARNAVWAYEEPLDEVRPIAGHCAFDTALVGQLAENDGAAAFLRVPAAAEPPAASDAGDPGEAGGAGDPGEAGGASNPIAGWLLREAWKLPTPETLTAGFCACLVARGVPIARMTVIIPTLHPQIFASVFVWRDDTGTVRTILEPHDILHRPKFAQSPFAPIIKGEGGVRRRMEGDHPRLDFPVLRELHAEGATDYVAMPFAFSDGQLNVMSMTSFVAGGFSTAHLGNIFELLPILARLFEVHAQRRISVGLLETYLGRNTGRRVLEGHIRHGDGELIHAVIWLCDLRNSTVLCETLDQATYLANLNRFFSAMAGTIVAHGGEILSYIGDAVLAIFPIADRAPARHGSLAATACAQAVDAARAAGLRMREANAEHPEMPALRYGIGLTIGDVTYGNIGIPERLQFTVIGTAANEASRIEALTKELGEPVLVSAEFARHYAGPLVGKGLHTLKGLARTQEVFGLG
ncbi:MAG: DUF427 domain-containing protein [Casimicrobiaceae bacterium]